MLCTCQRCCARFTSPLTIFVFNCIGATKHVLPIYIYTIYIYIQYIYTIYIYIVYIYCVYIYCIYILSHQFLSVLGVPWPRWRQPSCFASAFRWTWGFSLLGSEHVEIAKMSIGITENPKWKNIWYDSSRQHEQPSSRIWQAVEVPPRTGWSGARVPVLVHCWGTVATGDFGFDWMVGDSWGKANNKLSPTIIIHYPNYNDYNLSMINYPNHNDSIESIEVLGMVDWVDHGWPHYTYCKPSCDFPSAIYNGFRSLAWWVDDRCWRSKVVIFHLLSMVRYCKTWQLYANVQSHPFRHVFWGSIGSKGRTLEHPSFSEVKPGWETPITCEDSSSGSCYFCHKTTGEAMCSTQCRMLRVSGLVLILLRSNRSSYSWQIADIADIAGRNGDPPKNTQSQGSTGIHRDHFNKF